MNSTSTPAFFAYPSEPATAETIRNGVSKINDTGVVHLKTWESCKVGGKLVINEICNAIDQAKLFCADITYLNHNVMFELGYAIAKNKRVWLIIDPSVIETKADFERLKILTTVGYSTYQNSDNIREKFLHDQPWVDLDETIFNQAIKSNLPSVTHDTVFYLKSRHGTEASTLISKEVAKAASAMDIRLIIDDPRETSVQPLAWYGEQAFVASCVIVHLINPTREGAHLHNAKYSFIAGLAFGLNKPLLMLAQGDFFAPLDYREKLKQYQTGSEAERQLHQWLVPIVEGLKKRTNEQQLYLSTVKLAHDLSRLKIGEPIAENESENLIHDYFVETTTYREALDGHQTIFVGRKGAGKSASFLKLGSALKSDRRNLVCIIKPLSYEMHGIVDLLQRNPGMYQKGYAIESIWKFLIYSEIALSTEAMIVDRPSGQVQECEKNLIAVLDQNSEMLRQDFSVRLERCIQALLGASTHLKGASIEQSRVAVSETLHLGLLRKLREVLVTALAGKERIAIIVDNLDKAWDKQNDITELAEFLLGLLSTTSRVATDFKNVGPERKTLNVSLAVFVRSDIFYRVMSIAREPDKIVYSKMNWNDDEMLIRVIEERFSNSLSIPPPDVWRKYFCPIIHEIPTKAYFLSKILKRPRDLLFFVKAAITTAVNRRHTIVEEHDILDAEKQYSQFAVDSVLVENGITITELEKIIYEFVGSNSIVTEPEIFTILDKAGIPQDKFSYIIKHLCNLTFLGAEVSNDDFRFADDQSESQKNTVLAQRLVASSNRPPRYKIYPAFWAFLEIHG